MAAPAWPRAAYFCRKLPRNSNLPGFPSSMCLQCSSPAWRGMFIMCLSSKPGKRLFTRIHIPGFHITALLKTSQAGGTQSLGRMRTLSSHLPGSCNLYKFSSSVGCRLNIKPLKTFPASEHQRKGRAGADWGVPLLCVQGNTDPAAARRLRLPEGQTTAQVMRRFRPKASAWSVFVLVCGTRACPSTSFGQPWTLFFANSSQDSPGAGTGSDPENRQEQTFVPTSQSSTLPS